VLVLGSWTAGCGSSQSPDTPDGSAGSCDGGCWRPTAADLAFIDSFCALTEPCCVAVGERTQANLDRCRTVRRQAGVSRDPALRTACLAKLQAIASSQACLPEPLDDSNPCTHLTNEPSGPIPGGGSGCTSSADCAGAPGKYTFCLLSSCMQLDIGKAGDGPCLGEMNASGVTIASPYIGQSFLTTGVVCRFTDGLFCQPSNTVAGAVCSPIIADGAPCMFSRFCASGFCETNAGGVCATSAPIGSSCDNAPCGPGSYCAAATRTCAPTLNAGAACSLDGDCVSHECKGGTCSLLSGGALLGYCF